MLDALQTAEIRFSLLIFLTASLLLSFVFLLLIWRHLRRLQARQLHFDADLHAMVVAAVGVGERVYHIERQLRQLDERQEQLDHHDAGGQTYQQAIKRAQSGASAEELIELYGLTRGEAELIALLHRMERH